MRRLTLIALSALSLSACGGGGGQASRDQIKIVGSSTVYPFTTMVAEQFVNSGSFKAPVIESTGTGGGMKLFCAGVGPQHPDMTNASRRMTASEFDLCQRNGVTDILEVQVGMDGIAFAESVDGPKIKLTLAEAYRALAANPMGKPNTAKLWSDINPALPAVPISIMGPPATSGTRDSLHELIMHPGCEEAYPEVKEIEKTDKDKATELCTRVREDGAYVDSGENDNLIVQKLAANPNAIGVFGYSYLEENAGRLKGVPVNGVEPSYEAISSGRYPGARAMFIYVKKQHLKAVPGINEFLAQYTKMWDPEGPLTKRGMIASSDAARAKASETIAQGTPMQRSDLE
ncbi:phosphate ABC transporter substrate-binding protein [Sphingomonas suaedae]|uniref:Phosphate ABC transporter substrate-binding protein n=1 Tax=Sphingomonas suaedae TaxID=2599297 RepID=A0A518RB55_9SPHN|nr:substrate-binding domain-containing protein [Sphingomonas suaedae]QDX24690.1 phosphate ABC transporter substrate-binding protein [Sphingomonas suaedae]